MKLLIIFIICFAVIALALIILIKHMTAIFKGNGCKTCTKCENCSSKCSHKPNNKD